MRKGRSRMGWDEDGSDLILDTDLYGNRVTGNVLPGPFAAAPSGQTIPFR